MAKSRNKPPQPRRTHRRMIPAMPELLAQTKPATAWDKWGGVTVAILLMAVAYFPILDNGFVSWDDDHYIYDNHQVHYNDGIKSIWGDRLRHSDPKFERSKSDKGRVSHQYYPILFTMFWLEFRYHVWVNDADPNKTVQENIKDGKMTACIFHVVSILLHAINLVLLTWCMRALGMSNWVAWAAVILFALHPMHASSVAWAAEGKNMLSLMFYLLAMISYIKLRRSGGWWFYVLSLVLFQAALFSKTVAVTLPVMLFFTDRLLEKRWDLESVVHSALRILPFCVLSALAAFGTIQIEDRQRTIPITDPQRPLVAGAAWWFYPVQMMFPLKLSPIYPLWKPDLARFLWYVPMLGALAAAALMVVFRKKLGRHFLWAVLFYTVTMFPMLGFKNINYFQFSFVADHYFYHGAVGLIIILALSLDWLRRWLGPQRHGTVVMSSLVSVAAIGLAAYTFSYCDTWQTPDTFWQRTLKMNPACWPAYYNTGNARSREAHKEKDPAKRNTLLDKAAYNYEKTIENHPVITQPYSQLVTVRTRQRNWAKVLEAAEMALERWPSNRSFIISGGGAAYKLKQWDKAARHLKKAVRGARSQTERLRIQGRLADAYFQTQDYAKSRAVYDEMSKADPDNTTILARLGSLSMLMQDYRSAVDHFERANEIKPNDPKILEGLEYARRMLQRSLERDAQNAPPTQ